MSARPAHAAAADPLRTKELAAIHVAKKELGLEDDDYRSIIGLMSHGRTNSSAALTGTERRKLIEHFRNLGFQKVAKKPLTPAERRADFRPQALKLSALWYSLYQLGVVRAPDRDACAAFVCRHTQIQVMKWNDSEDLRQAIECLKAWCEREGYSARTCDVAGPQLGSFKPALIQAQWDRLIKLGALRNGIHAGLDTWMHRQGWIVSAPCFLEDADAEEAIKRLGHWLRKLVKPEGADG